MENLPDRVKVKIKVNRKTQCWEWQAVRDKRKYGLIMGSKKEGFVHKRYFAHRYVYEILKGPPGAVLDHLCRRPQCVNPSHLESVTQRENVLRGKAHEVLRKLFAKKRKCPQGHWIWGENLYLYINKKGLRNRQCRICKSEGSKRAKLLAAVRR